MIRKHLFLTEKQVERLHALAEATGLPLGELVRRALDEYMDREEATNEVPAVSQ